MPPGPRRGGHARGRTLCRADCSLTQLTCLLAQCCASATRASAPAARSSTCAFRTTAGSFMAVWPAQMEQCGPRRGMYPPVSASHRALPRAARPAGERRPRGTPQRQSDPHRGSGSRGDRLGRRHPEGTRAARRACRCGGGGSRLPGRQTARHRQLGWSRPNLGRRDLRPVPRASRPHRSGTRCAVLGGREASPHHERGPHRARLGPHDGPRAACLRRRLGDRPQRRRHRNHRSCRWVHRDPRCADRTGGHSSGGCEPIGDDPSRPPRRGTAGSRRVADRPLFREDAK